MNRNSGSTGQEAIQEHLLSQIAQQMRYPATPDVAGRWQRGASSVVRPQGSRLLWATAGIALACIVVLLASPLRAGIAEWLRLGAVRIEMQPETALVHLNNIEGHDELAAILPRLHALTTLAEAAAASDFPLQAPRLLPAPDGVYRSSAVESEVVTLVWNGSAGQPAALLQIFGPGIIVHKMQPQSLQAVQVNGEYAIWTTGPYLALTSDGTPTERMLVRNHALIWTDGDVTYRLESALPLAEAVRIAESLAPVIAGWTQD